MLTPFHIFAILSDGEGRYHLDTVITHLETDQEIYSLRVEQSFPDRLTTVRLNLRIEQCLVPDYGTYQVSIQADGQWVCQRSFQVLPREQLP